MVHVTRAAGIEESRRGLPIIGMEQVGTGGIWGNEERNDMQGAWAGCRQRGDAMLLGQMRGMVAQCD